MSCDTNLLGCIPKEQHHFGNCYAKSCHRAFTDFQTDQNKQQHKMAGLRNATFGKEATPLTPIAAKAKPYFSAARDSRFSTSYSSTPDGYRDRVFVSGYTGFIPRIQKYIGHGYPIISHQAFREHTEAGKERLKTMRLPIILDQPQGRMSAMVGIYPRECGLVPHYAGHVPGN